MPEIAYTETLVVCHCHCGIALAIPQNLYRTAHETRKDVYCPLGHTFVWTETFEQRFERERERVAEERRRVEATRALLRAEERSHRTTRGHLTRARKRAAAGVCPCCHRTFANVARHVETKHPELLRDGG